MKLVLSCLGIVSLFELILWLAPFWRWRRAIASVLLIALSVVSGLLLGEYLGIWSIVLVCLSLYRIVNLLRLVENRIHGDYLFNVARRTTIILIGMQLIVLIFAAIDHHFHLHSLVLWYILLACQCICGLILVTSTVRHLRTTQPPILDGNYADRDLPTITVAIPARNETDDLNECLQSLVASDYPKLEILVLDDCSQEKRTPEIIRQFAHDGVRFIAGKVPPERWLAKNYAYLQLTHESNGEILLFCGVDARFQKDTLRALVKIMLQKQKSMLSVLPMNQLTSVHGLESMLVQPSRYAWELALPRRWLNRPPVLSTCWLITRRLLEEAGGFEAIGHSVSPESYFARQAISSSDGYSFMQSDTEQIGLSCIKSLGDQRATAIRTRYPQLHRRPELVGLLSMAEIAVLVLPYLMLITGLIQREWYFSFLSLFNCLLITIVYSKIVNMTYRTFLLRGLWLLPFAALYDVALLNYSMWQYEFREVIWKDRNVCIPVMRTFKSLPHLK